MKSKYNKMLKMEKVSDLMKWAHGCLIILLSHFSKYFFFFLKKSTPPLSVGWTRRDQNPLGGSCSGRGERQWVTTGEGVERRWFQIYP